MRELDVRDYRSTRQDFPCQLNTSLSSQLLFAYNLSTGKNILFRFLGKLVSKIVMYELAIIRCYLVIMPHWTGLFQFNLISVVSTTDGQEV
jgi:hypothetical protein